MTYSQIQLKLQELFNVLAESSNKVSELKNKLFQLEAKYKESKETADTAKNDCLKVKKGKVVNLNTFSILKKARDTADSEQKQLKLNRTVLQKELASLQKQTDFIKKQYETVEKLFKKALDNVEKINESD